MLTNERGKGWQEHQPSIERDPVSSAFAVVMSSSTRRAPCSVPGASEEWMVMSHALVRHEQYSRHLRERSPVRTVVEVRGVFKSLSEQLLWFAEVITGDSKLAARCVINASKLAEYNSKLFRNWLAQWAQNATVRSSLAAMHAEILHTAKTRYERVQCPHGGHEALSSGEVAALQQWPASELTSHLDPLSRVVLILRGVQQEAIQNCALTLGVPRAAILAAYCGANDWLARGTVSLSNQCQAGLMPSLVQSLRKP
jgi:hypothetical protein